MSIEKADSTHARQQAAPEAIVRAAAIGTEKSVEGRMNVAATTAARAADDHAAVKQGILPEKPEIFDSSNPAAKSPVSPSDAFSKNFAGMKSGEFKYDRDGAIYSLTTDSDGTRRMSSEKNGTTREEVIHPDKSTELTTSGKGVLETSKWDANGNLRSDTVNKARTPDGNLNFSEERNWNAKGQLAEDYKRWQSNDGQWHEDHAMNMPDGTKISQKMDGDRTVTRTTRPDGSWENVVKTMNVDAVNPETGKHYKTMTVDRTESK